MRLASLGELADPDVPECDATASEPLAGVLKEVRDMVCLPVLISGVSQSDHGGTVARWNRVLMDARRAGYGLGHLTEACIVHIDGELAVLELGERVTC